MRAAKDFLFGFIMAIATAAGMVLLFAFIFFGFDSPSDIEQSVFLALAATALILLLAGGEIAASFLFSWDTPIGVKIMHFAGAAFAIVATYFASPLILGSLDASNEKGCKTVYEVSVGPISFSRADCND